ERFPLRQLRLPWQRIARLPLDPGQILELWSFLHPWQKRRMPRQPGVVLVIDLRPLGCTSHMHPI
ncbi:hypothetical protein, partial [Pseudogemmobacter sonorensis]|uniref:hypothetical protein n=1 Tax=Pseudogemmobacter sonorensis TaxID=2989681 RepID=UPI00367ED887